MAGQPQEGNLTNFTFDVTALKFKEPGELPRNIIESDTDFDTIVSFKFDGPTALFMVSLGLKMRAFVEFEGLGAGDEVDKGPIEIVTVTGKKEYEVSIPVKAGDLGVGTYRVQANVIGPDGSLIAGYSEKVEILQIIPG